MAVITNYATLQTAIADYLAKENLTSYIPNFVQNAENKLYRSINLRNEETALDLGISSGVATVPTDFKALKFAYFDDSPAELLDWVPVEQIYRDHANRSQSSTPCQISREGSSFIFGPSSKDGTLKGIYYAKQEPLRTTDGSWYVLNAPDVLLYASLLEATPFIQGDERIPVWQQFLAEAIQTLKDEEKSSSVSKGSLVQRVS